jgi:hypothetical protein
MSVKHLLYPIALIGILTLSCNKNPGYDDLSGTGIIRGVVVLYDTLTGPHGFVYTRPIPVYLRYPSDSSGYLYSTMTNSSGQFSFSGIDNNKAYVAFASFDSAQVQFVGQFTYPALQTADYVTDTLRLYPSQTNENGIFLQLQDTLGGALAGFKVFIFNSRPLWANNDSLGNVYSLVSDPFGRAVQLNVSPGWYWIHAPGVFHNLTLQASDSVLVDTQGISQRKTITLRTATAAYGNGFSLFLTDSTGTPLANATVYVFSSRVLWGNNDSTGNIFTLQTDINGKCIQQNLIPGEYYFHAQKALGNLFLEASDSVAVPPLSLKLDSLVLTASPAAYGDGMLFYLQDSAGDPLGNCTLYVFSSKQLWINDDSTGSVFRITSDYTGKCLLQNIAPGEYYVHALGVFTGTSGPLTLAAPDSVQVSYDSLSIQYLQLTRQ